MMVSGLSNKVNYNDKVSNIKVERIKKLFKLEIKAVVRDKNGKIIKIHKQEMRSLTQNFLAFMSIPLLWTFQGQSTNEATQILQTYLGLPSNQSTYSGNGAMILIDYSIQVGSGTQSFSPTLTSLDAPISNGTGTGELNYNTLSISYSSGGYTYVQVVSNSTLETINVSEIGLVGIIHLVYVNSYNAEQIDKYKALLSYDVLTTAISIPPGGSATFEIKISFTGW